jgi:hypothetical protein
MRENASGGDAEALPSARERYSREANAPRVSKSSAVRNRVYGRTCYRSLRVVRDSVDGNNPEPSTHRQEAEARDGAPGPAVCATELQTKPLSLMTYTCICLQTESQSIPALPESMEA